MPDSSAFPGPVPAAPADRAANDPSQPAAPRRPAWTVVLPVKGGPGAKSRLGGPAGLAAAIALDTIESSLACTVVGAVVVVTPDPDLARAARARGAAVRQERHPGSGLDAAVADGLREAHGPVAVLLADLPAMRAADLDSALVQVGAGLATARWVVVPDADGRGTVLIAANEPGILRPAFGRGSAAAHEARGARRLDLDLPRLRCDVDTPADLERARRLGVGPHTSAALGLERVLPGLP